VNKDDDRHPINILDIPTGEIGGVTNSIREKEVLWTAKGENKKSPGNVNARDA